jgi:hypothetical protein
MRKLLVMVTSSSVSRAEHQGGGDPRRLTARNAADVHVTGLASTVNVTGVSGTMSSWYCPRRFRSRRD